MLFFLLLIYYLEATSATVEKIKRRLDTRHSTYNRDVGVYDRMKSIRASSIKKVNLHKHTDLIWDPVFGTLSLRPALEDDHNTSYGYIINITISLIKLDFMDVFPSA